MLDLLLDKEGDLLLSDLGDVALTSSVSQAIKIRLRWFFAEWKLGTIYGVPYYEEILIKGYSLIHAEQLLREQILSVDEVDEILSFKMSLNKAGRTLAVDFTVKVGEEAFQEEVKLNV